MSPDVILTVGILFIIFAFPAFFAAFADKRRPYFSFGLLTTGAVLIYTAFQRKPNGYLLEDVPDIVVLVVAGWFM